MAKKLNYPLEDHPAASIFPLLPDAKLKELAEDIGENGLRVPILIYEGKILDGRNRYRAMQLIPDFAGELERENYNERSADGLRDPVGYVISLNLQRRQLTSRQRVAAAAELANRKEGRPEKTASIEAVSQDTAAKLMKVSRASVQRAVALKKASPEKFEEFKAGKISLNAALKAVKPDPVPVPTSTPEPPKSWTAPEVSKEQDQSEPQTNPHLDTVLIEALTTAIKMVGNPEGLNRGELRSALARARALIDQKLEDL